MPTVETYGCQPEDERMCARLFLVMVPLAIPLIIAAAAVRLSHRVLLCLTRADAASREGTCASRERQAY